MFELGAALHTSPCRNKNLKAFAHSVTSSHDLKLCTLNPLAFVSCFLFCFSQLLLVLRLSLILI